MKDDVSLGSDDEVFDLRVRAELALAFEPGAVPASLLRQPPRSRRRVYQSIAAALILTTGIATAVAWLSPPSLVRDAIAHEYYERTLRGTYMEPHALLHYLGRAPNDVIPGAAQLMRVCVIDGQRAAHFTTYFEGGGIVTVFAFTQKVALHEGSGRWGSVHWRVITSREGKPLLLVAQQKQALATARTNLLAPSV